MLTIYVPQSLRIGTPEGALFHAELEQSMKGYVANHLTTPNTEFGALGLSTPSATRGKSFVLDSGLVTQKKHVLDRDGNKIDLATWGTIPDDKKLFEGVYYRFELIEDTAKARAH